MPDFSALETVQAWQDALNRGDRERVLHLSDPGIELFGPRGSAFGLGVLRQWLEQTRVQLMPMRTFADDQTVVVEHRGIWREPGTGETIGEGEVGSVFRVQDGLVAYYARFDSIGAALDHAGIRPA